MTRRRVLLAAGVVVVLVAASPLVAGAHRGRCTDGPTLSDVVDLVQVGPVTYVGVRAAPGPVELGGTVLQVRCRLTDAALRDEDPLRDGDATVLLSGTPVRQVLGVPEELAVVEDGRVRLYEPRSR